MKNIIRAKNTMQKTSNGKKEYSICNENIDIEKALHEIFCHVLQLRADDLTFQSDFGDIGISSINSVDLMERINRYFNFNLPTSLIFEFGNIELLARHLVELLNYTKDDSRIYKPRLQKESQIETNGKYFKEDKDMDSQCLVELGANKLQGVKDIRILEKEIKLLLSKLLMLQPDDLTYSTDFSEIGVDSIKTVEIQEAVNQKYNLNLPTSAILQFSNISSLATFIHEKLLVVDKYCDTELIDTKTAFAPKVDRSSASVNKQISDIKQQSTNNAKYSNISSVKNRIKEVFVRVLKLESRDIDFGLDFYELGISSINAVELLEAINMEYGFQFPTSIMFQFSNINALAQYIDQEIILRFEKLNTLKSQQTRTQFGSQLDSGKNEIVNSDQKMVLALDEVHLAKNNEQGSRFSVEGIAVIGLSCRSAGADNHQEFWEILRDGQNCIQEIQDGSWLKYLSLKRSDQVIRYGSVESKKYFDNMFFGISPREAEQMDPMQRVLLEECYKAIEDSGYAPSSLNGREVGVIIGAMQSAPASIDGSHFSLLGSEHSILASRVSYFLNLKGPALCINTSCSSSLVAIDMACQKLYSGDVELAITGGVTIYTHPIAFASMQNAGMYSPTGECRPFDDDADGIVVGDGAGIVILKRLCDAVSDRDQIYAVIKGSGTNQDGKTSGITVPSYLAQSKLIESVYRRNNIDPENIQYIEAHGTATKLGDPVEIHALSSAFGQFTDKKEFCGIGSLKANIGHTTAASGVLSLIKVCLSLKYNQLPPSINFKRNNQHIEFSHSPVYVNSTLKDWPRPATGSRMAAISSFGFSGTNAHLVLEQFVDDSKYTDSSEALLPALVILSARRQEDLLRKSTQLLSLINKLENIGTESNSFTLQNIAYTLQVGRDAMVFRAGFVVNSIEDLSEQLGHYVNKKPIDPIDQDIQLSKNEQSLLASNCIESKNWDRLVELWVSGFTIDWRQLYKDFLPLRVSLPQYPFLKEKYWRDIDSPDLPIQVKDKNIFHPLLHENTSDLYQQRYTTVLTGHEFFLSEHQVNGHKVLPGAVYMEMARAAVERATSSEVLNAKRGMELRNVAFLIPFLVTTQTKLHISLCVENDEDIGFEIYSFSAQYEVTVKSKIVHCRGKASFTEPKVLTPICIPELTKNFDKGVVKPSECYSKFRDMGIHYGGAFQGLESICIGDNQLLAKISIPRAVSNTVDDFLMHPSIVDGVFQSSLCLFQSAKNAGDNINNKPSPSLLFSIDKVAIYGKCEKVAWAWLRVGEDVVQSVQKFNIEVYDELGHKCLDFIGCNVRELVDSDNSIKEEKGKRNNVIRAEKIPSLSEYLSDQFAEHDDKNIAEGISMKFFSYSEIGEVSANKFDELMSCMVLAQLESIGLFQNQRLCLKSANEKIKVRYEKWLAETIRALLERKLLSQQAENYILCMPSQSLDFLQQQWSEFENQWLENADLAAHARLVKATLWSLPEILVGDKPATEVIFPGSSMSLVEGIYKGNPTADYHNSILVDVLETYVKERYKNDPGVKLKILEIGAGTGGTSSLVFDRLKKYEAFIDQYSYTDVSKAFLLHAQQHYLPTTPYLSTAIFDVESPLQNQGIVLGNYDVVIASNVLHATQNISNTLQNVKAALKRDGLLLLNEMTNNSLFAHLTFGLLDGWWRYKDTELRVKGSPILSVFSWKNALNSAGFKNIIVPNANLSTAQNIILAESDGIIKQNTELQIAIQKNVSDTTKENASASLDFELSSFSSQIHDVEKVGVRLQKRTINYLKTMVGKALKMPNDQIDENQVLENYGIDSILVTQFTDELRQLSPDISSTVFFEYQTIQAVGDYLVKSSRQELLNLFQDEIADSTESNDTLQLFPEWDSHQSVDTPFSFKGRRKTLLDENLKSDSEMGVDNHGSASPKESIAIIGLAGRYPKANSIDEFWENIKLGQDCIVEIPEERWRLEGFYNDDPDEAVNRGMSYNKWGGFIDGFADFDPLFFNISPREAINIDPQERLFLQTSWEVLEDAGYTRASLKENHQGNVGVFVGISTTGFDLYGPELRFKGCGLQPHTSFGSVANRVSYFFDLSGPSMPIDTLCSSSLTAIHEACEHLLRNECELAIAGGVNLYLHPSTYIGYCSVGMLSKGKYTKSFGDGGDGFVPGEGVGAILLKPLSNAVQDFDNIYGVIKSTSINHGGKTNGYMVPNPNAQSELIEKALRKAEINPRAVSYIEAHGTGTSLGDPIEITGLNKAFSKFTRETQFCAIGSAKSNIGHLVSAAGIAGVTKVLLQIKYRTLVPSLYSSKVNRLINFEKTAFKIQHELNEWSRPRIVVDNVEKEFPRIAGVSSFGAGGSNAHIIIQEHFNDSLETKLTLVEHPSVILLSAKSEQALIRKARDLALSISKNQFTEKDIPNIAYTLQIGREAMEFRLSFAVLSISEFVQKLTVFADNGFAVKNDEIFFGKKSTDLSAVKRDTGVDHLQSIYSSALDKNDRSILLKMWVEGTEVDWRKRYLGGDNPRRISLPTYPFQVKKYWFDINHAIPLPTHGQYQMEDHLAIRSGSNSDFSVDEFRGQVVEVFAAAFEIEKDIVDVNKDLQDYGVDSVTGRRLMRDLEILFNIEISSREMFELRTINDIVKNIENKVAVAFKKSIEVATRPGSNFSEVEAKIDLNGVQIKDRSVKILEQFKAGKISMDDIQLLIDEEVLL